MKSKNFNRRSNFVEYNDENIDHACNGPDYGQPWSSSHAWMEINSKEYPDFVLDIRNKILNNKVKI